MLNVASDMNEKQGRKVGKLELMVLNIRTRDVLQGFAVLSARATKSFFGGGRRNSHSQGHSFRVPYPQVMFKHYRIRSLLSPAVTPTRPCNLWTALNPWSGRCGCDGVRKCAKWTAQGSNSSKSKE